MSDRVKQRVSRPWAVGDVVAERYELLEALGEGLSGSVYRARDLYVETEREIVALKLIHGELLGDKQIAGRFRREAEILQRLKGPNLCPLLDVVEEDGLLLLAIEYVDGPSLDRYLEGKEQLPLEEVVALTVQVCAALQVAHEAGVVHRDLKPSNVLIAGGRRADASFTRELVARVVDFGLAKIIQGEGDKTALTERNMIFGTPEYMAPEQVAGEALDARADVYAAGVMLYQLLTGRLPFEHDGAVATMKAHLSDPVPSPREVTPSLPPAVESVVLKALAKAPGERHASARELADALVEAAESGGAPKRESDTQLDLADASTTMRSKRDTGGKVRGAKVQIVVPESARVTAQSLEQKPETPKPPPSRPSEPRRSDRGASSKGKSGKRKESDPESRVWAVVAVVAAIAAIVAGVWFGLH